MGKKQEKQYFVHFFPLNKKFIDYVYQQKTDFTII